MKNILIFIGGVAVGILAVTGVYALDEEVNNGSHKEVASADDEINDSDEDRVSDRLEELLDPDGS